MNGNFLFIFPLDISVWKTDAWPETMLLPKFIKETFLEIYITLPFLKFYGEGLY